MHWRLPGTALLLPCLGAAVALAADGRHPTSQETRREFESICQRLRESDNPYYGEGLLRDTRERARQSGGQPSAAAARHGHYAWHLMRLGRPVEALDELQRARELLVGTANPPEELRRDLLLLEALAHLQAGEDLNCVDMHNAASCILPAAPPAIHPSPEHARRAGDLLLELLAIEPSSARDRWLLNVSRIVSGDYPAGVPEALRLPADVALAAGEHAWRNVAPLLGLDVVDLAGGAVTEDFDRDGRLDVVTSTSDPCDGLKAFRNRGDGSFEEVTAAWGLDGQLGGLNLMQTDYDNDGAPDLLVLRGGWWGRDGRVRNSLLRNGLAGGGAFVDVTAAAGLAYPAYPTQTAAWADFDGDGDLDLYVGNESEDNAVYTAQSFLPRSGPAYPSQLFRNNGDGTFTDVAAAAGVENGRYAKGVAWGDFDNDGDPDLYVSNIGPNRLYRNRGDGTFVDVAGELGVTEPAGRSFPVWFFDYDNDGWLDLLVADYGADIETVFRAYFGLPTHGGHPLLYHNEGGRFREVSEALGLDRPILPMGANYGDLDGDGWPDLFFGTGVPDFESLMPNAVYRNRQGEGFEEVTFAYGLGHIQKGHGVAFADLDNDGDQDVLQQLGGAYPFDRFANALYLNPGYGHHWIVLRLEGRQANRAAIGARVEVRLRQGGAQRSVHLLAGSGGSFGASSLQQEIGLGDAEGIDLVRIRWPGSGTEQTFETVAMDRVYAAVEGEPRLLPLDVDSVDLLAAGNRPAPSHSHRETNP